MGRIIVTEFVSLDGVMEAPGGDDNFVRGAWTFEFDRGDAGNQFKIDETMGSAALLLGRRTYEGFSAAWPERDGEFADKMNTMPKDVVSSALRAPAWAGTGEIGREEVPGPKESTDLLVAGSGSLVHALLERGWIDELRMMMFPVVLGSG